MSLKGQETEETIPSQSQEVIVTYDVYEVLIVIYQHVYLV